MLCNLREKLLYTYKKTHRPGIGPYIFGVPFTIGGIPFVVLAICAFVFGEIVTGFLLLLGGAVFMFIAYIFGWGELVDYIKICRVIKQEKYATIRAECKSKTIRQERRYHDSADIEDYGTLTFESNSQKYILEDWDTFHQIETNSKYLLILFESNSEINAILNEDTNKWVYFKQ